MKCRLPPGRFAAVVPKPAIRQLPCTLKLSPLSRLLASQLYQASGREEAGGEPHDEDSRKRKGRPQKGTEHDSVSGEHRSVDGAPSDQHRAQQDAPVQPNQLGGSNRDVEDPQRTTSKKRIASRQRRQIPPAGQGKSSEKEHGPELLSGPAHETAARDMELRIVMITRLNLKPDAFRPPRSSWKRLKVRGRGRGKGLVRQDVRPGAAAYSKRLEFGTFVCR